MALATIAIVPSIGLKLLLIFLFGTALFLFLRSLSPSSTGDAAISYERLRQQNESRFARSASRLASSHGHSEAPVSNELGRIRVTQFNFSQFDALPGPPDPDCFADELFIELLDPVEDHRWTVSFVVATPAGIRKLMDDERWSFFYSTEVFIVRRYDLPTIRDAVYGRIKEIHEEVGLTDHSGRPPVVG